MQSMFKTPLPKTRSFLFSMEQIITDKQQLVNLYMKMHEKLKKEGVIKVSIKSMKTKTNEQLGYYWSAVVPTITKELNERGLASAMLTEADVNEVLNRKFFTENVVIDGEMLSLPRSKAEATKEEMSKFLEDVLMWASNMEIDVPPPLMEDVF